MNESNTYKARLFRRGLLISVLPLLLAGCCQLCNQEPKVCAHPPVHGKMLLDDGGKPIVDNEGCPTFAQCAAKPANSGNMKLDNGGKPIVDDEGCPTYAQCARPEGAGAVKLDDGGKPIVDNEGCIEYSQCTIIEGATPKLDSNGNPMFSALGCPLYQAP